VADDIAKRIQRTTARAAEPGGSVVRPAPFIKAERTYPHRVTLDLTAEQYSALRTGAYQGRSTIANILRALVEQWSAEPELARTIQARLDDGRRSGTDGTDAQKHRGH
jgi:hypothetical protein